MSDAARLRKQLERLISEAAADSRIRNTAERLLALKPRDVLALQCKAVCCIHAEKFGAALAVLDLIAPGELTAADVFHRAYCHYRMQQYVEARHTLEQHDALTAHHAPSLNLRAQIHYHLEEYTAAAEIYAELLRSDTIDADTRVELLTNYTAALAGSDPTQALRVVQSATEATAADEESFDLFYNAAAAQLAMGEYSAALQTLRRAEAVCAALYPDSKVKRLEDILSEDETNEKQKANNATRAEKMALLACPLPGQPVTTERNFFNEVANIWLQMGFVHHALHDDATALNILQLVLRLKPNSVVTSAIASINWVALQREENYFEALHKLKTTQQVKVARRLTARQKLAALYNMVLLYLHNGNLAQARKLLEQLVKEHPQSELTHTLRLALAVRESNNKKKKSNTNASQAGNEAASLVEDYLQAYERSLTAAQRESGTLQLVTAQLALEQGDLAGAIAALSSAQLGPLQHHPVVIATLTAWRVQSQDVDSAMKYLTTEVIQRASTSLAEAKALLLWAVHYLASPSRELYAESARLLREVRVAVPALRTDQEVLALLALCLSHVDLGAAQGAMEETLASQNSNAAATTTSKGNKAAQASMPAGSANDEREETVIEGPSRATLETLGYRRPMAAANGGKEGPTLRRRRPRPMRRPPRSSEGGRPDPERWLPMSVRSYIKDLPPRRKKELKRLRALDQEQKRRLREKRKAEAAQEAV